jgi:predicted transcriptional regulator
MATQEDMLAELRALNAELGLSENDGIESTSTYEQNLQELRALDKELASTPESFDEYVARRKQEDSRSLGEKTSAFTDSFITGAGTLAEEGGRAIKQLFAGDVGLKEAKGVFQVGVKDFGRFAETLGGAAMDNFYSDENEMQREYERYKDNFLYNQNVRTAMLDTFDEKGRDFVSFGANFVDPTMFIPIAGQVAKATSIGLKSARLGKVAKAIEKGGAIASKPTELIAKGTRKALEKTAQAGSKIAGATGKAGEVTSKVAAFPRDMVTRFASKTIDPKVAGSGILGAQVTGAFTGAVPGLGLLTSAEVAGYIANKSGRGMERVLTALGSEAGQKRFLQRLAMQADSPTTRKLALYAHKLGGTRMGDMAFNSLVNGISVSTLNGALAYASTDNIEELGQAMGAGFAMGGALPVGQPGMRAGRSQAARNQSSVNFLEAKLGQDQLKHFRKMDPDARLAFATVEEAGIKAPKLMFVDKDLMLKTLREDDQNIRQAPNAYFDQTDNTIYVNENGRASKSSKEAFDILTHELGHGFITQAIKDDPFFARKILEQYEAKPGEKSFEFAFTEDSAGAPIDSIMLNEDAKKIASAYDSIQEGDKSIGVGQDANLLAQEIGAEQFAMMMVDNPNYFNTIEPSLRQKLLEGSRKVLTLFGAVDGNTGNPLDVSISPILKRNKSIRNLYKNYTKQRDASIADKVDLADKGVAIKVRKGESADQAVERLYGKQGISLKEAGAFRIDNKKVKNELTNILNRVDETPEGGMSSERNPRSGRPQAIVGKQLSDEVKGVFTRKDPRGTINMLINDITESIRNRLQLNFLYRSGKPSKYSDNELKARVVSPVRFKVTGLSKTSRSAASLKMDAIDEAYLRNNVEVLTKEGFADNPSDLIELARKVAREALDDEEGRINPKGKYENELVTAVFGQPESAPQIRNAKLRQLLEDKKLQHAYRSYDVDALAGLVPTGKSGIAFDWFNIKNNYSPFDDKLFIPKPEADVTVTDKLFMPAGDVMTAVNVRNELNNKFADLIVSGQKSIETRRSRSLDNLIGNRVKIVRTTGKGDEARVIGEVTVGEPIQYKTRAEFAKDYDKHLVDEDSDFAFQDGGKFGYPMINPERYDTPYPMPKRKGIVYTREVGGPDKLFMPASEAGATKGKVAEAADLNFKISTRNPTAKNATENPITEDLIINTASIADDATMLESHALALQEYPGIKKNSKVPKRIIDRFVDHVVDNLLYLHDQVRPEVRNRSKLWYDGARNITEKWNQQYGNDKQSIAAALASLSPQKDWFMNVDLARRMLDIYKDQSGFAFDKAMAKKYIQLFEKGIGKKKATEIAEAMVGKTLNELQSDFEQAAFIRSYDEVYNPREYQVVSPEGDFIGLAKSLDGVNKKVAWGSMTEISKAVKVLRNPSKESISTALGNAHKIRNFYNNILLPNADEFSVTIDTHAIAAALLRPLAGADLEVANNFGSKPKGAKRSIKNSSVKGISGTYGIYADAYRKAAEARGILPREMQSITWEAVRGLYEAKWKTKSNKAKIDNLWKKYENGELTLNETREQILESAGGITEPEWVTERSNSGADGTNESANKSQELYRSELGGSELRANPRRGRTNSRGSQEVNFLPAGNFSRQPANRITRQAPAMPGNRFMLPAASAGAKSTERFR